MLNQKLGNAELVEWPKNCKDVIGLLANFPFSFNRTVDISLCLLLSLFKEVCYAPPSTSSIRVIINSYEHLLGKSSLPVNTSLHMPTKKWQFQMLCSICYGSGIMKYNLQVFALKDIRIHCPITQELFTGLQRLEKLFLLQHLILKNLCV